jgi:hypothetical protein
MTARDSIRAKAVVAGWACRNLWERRSGEAADEYTKDAVADDRLAAMMTAGDVRWQPRLRVVAYYGIKGQVLDAFLQTPRQQSLITGVHTDKEARVQGKGRKGQVLSWLEWGSI